MKDTDKAKNCDRFHDFRSPSDNGFLSSLFVVGKGTLTGVAQLHPMNWVLVNESLINLFRVQLSIFVACKREYVLIFTQFQI